MDDKYIPRPLFDTSEHLQALFKEGQAGDFQQCIRNWLKQCLANQAQESYQISDYQQCLTFLYSYRGSPDTFNAYRRELERFFHWTWFIKKQSVCDNKRLDIEEFIEFCDAMNLDAVMEPHKGRY